MEKAQLFPYQAPRHNDAYVFAQLRKLGMRPTSARVCVLQVMHQHPDEPLAAEQIFQHFVEIGLSVSLGTIYRVLNEMEHSGLLQRERRADEATAKSRYRLAPEVLPPSSYAFCCRVCAKVMVVADKQFSETLYQQARSAGFDRMLPQMSIQVVCNDCA
ncbi:Fur family transcriptional regulator [Duganella aceris]|uniref:Ferric uptake regulation protein n=1 Tax=Duganella aceris TaxID=2703883 RepID=A0ABX0FJQ6_9BURK|nr:transcriptional repressor [Duganella aceris]NGZ84804.1 hypothetical protein [Duganella aceris]